MITEKRRAHQKIEADAEEIYEIYPKKAAPKKAKKAIVAAMKADGKATILAGMRKMMKALKEQGIVKGTPLWTKVRYPQGYFNDQMYLMDPQDFPWYAVNPTRLMGHAGKYNKFKKAHDGL